MINLLCAFRCDDHPIRLNRESFLYLIWWRELFCSKNGCSFLQYPQWGPSARLKVSSDASGALGYGALFQYHWLSGFWLATQVSQSIEYKELFPIVVAACVGSTFRHPRGSISYQIKAQCWKSCGQATREPLP